MGKEEKEDLDRIVGAANHGVVNVPALIRRLEDDANFVLAFLGSQGNEYLATQEERLKASVAIAAVKLERDARGISQGAIS